MKLHMMMSLLACSLVACSTTRTDDAGPRSISQGTIVFAQKMESPEHPSGKMCTLPVPSPGSAVEDFRLDEIGCGDNVATFFKFNNVPSSTQIWLVSEKSCEVDDWVFSLQAVKNPSSTLWVDIRTLKDAEVNKIVVPGMILLEDGYDHGNIEGKLSCVRVYPAALPAVRSE